MAATPKGKRAMRDLGQGKNPKQPPAVLNAPAGGTGAAAGGWDTAINRDAFITSYNLVVARLRELGIIT